MSFLAYICLLAFLFPLSTSTACALDFADGDGEGRVKLMNNENIPVTIHGEWTHCTRPPPPNSQVCTSVGTPTLHQKKLWYTSVSNINPALSNKFWIHECGEHRGPTEDGAQFKARVLTSCTAFEGYIGKIVCRIDAKNSRNIVNLMVLYHGPSPHIVKPTCNSDFPFFTSFDLQIMTNRQMTHKFDLNTNTYTRKDPGASPPSTTCYTCKK
ncbi:hypothetical protein RF11_04617 [Thelohanellus kitauei]|uniref:Uncharacterized protein n=1 Tax=Thelohanellus kitauei TaxID=669202 RepID=A0A0C2NC69_THEKT|nr:hypothetical protein RF11_04617 [Thelohanellus kitauei]